MTSIGSNRNGSGAKTALLNRHKELTEIVDQVNVMIDATAESDVHIGTDEIKAGISDTVLIMKLVHGVKKHGYRRLGG